MLKSGVMQREKPEADIPTSCAMRMQRCALYAKGAERSKMRSVRAARREVPQREASAFRASEARLRSHAKRRRYVLNDERAPAFRALYMS